MPHRLIYNSSPPISEEKEVKPPSPSIVLRSENDFLSSHKFVWDSPSDGEEEPEKRTVPDLLKDDLASRRVHHGPVISKVHQFLPSPACTNKDRERWEDIRRASQRTLQEKIRLAVCKGVFYILFPHSFVKFKISCLFPPFGWRCHLWVVMGNVCHMMPLRWLCDWTVRRKQSLTS